MSWQKRMIHPRIIGALALVATILVVAVPAPAVATAVVEASPDLPAIVLSEVAGYRIAPPGIGLSGQIGTGQMAGSPEASLAGAQLFDAVAANYARTFVTPQGRTAVIVGLDMGTVGAARSFEAGARQSSPQTGAVASVPGLDNAFRVAIRPDKLPPGTSAEQVFLQSGRLAFILAISDRSTSPVTDGDATDLAWLQAAAVPAEISAQKAEPGGAFSVGYAAGQAVGVMLLVGLVAAAVVSVRHRRAVR
ncbi:MAG: hypothetical protein QOG43_1038 [Actinomycetota bacterium]|jgi:hypothetical protein|nr:hypothetical protein [Actinomycetota bacterium]